MTNLNINDYIEIYPKYKNKATCGHFIIIDGEKTIGYNSKTKETLCYKCWLKACVEDTERPIDSLDKNWEELCNEIGENTK